MPSFSDPHLIATGPGKLHNDVVGAAADLYIVAASSGGSSGTTVLSQPLAVPVTSGDFTAAGGGDATRTLNSGSGPFYVGDSVSDSLQDLFKVVNSSDDTEVFNRATKSYVAVASISTPVGGGFFSGNLQLTFSTPVPAGVVYKVYYNKRSTLGNVPVELASFPMIRRSAERVRFPEFFRSGLAPTSIAVPVDTVTTSYPDPYLANWKAVIRGTTTGFYSPNLGGSSGFVSVGRKRNVNDANDVCFTGHQAAGFLAVYEKEILSGTLNGATALTKINPALSATVNPTGTSDVLTLNALDYFRLTGPHRTAVRLGVDMVELTFPGGLQEVFLISSFDATDPRSAHLMTLGGAAPQFVNGTVNVRWIRTGMFVGGDNDASTSQHNFKGFSHLVPGNITTNPTLEIFQTPPFFAAGTTDPTNGDLSRGGWNIKAFTWGAYTQTGTLVTDIGNQTVLGELWGDGSIYSYGGHISGIHNNRPDSHTLTGGTTAITWNPGASSLLAITITGSLVNTVNVSLAGAFTPADGDKFEMLYLQSCVASTAAEGSVVNWPGAFRFSGNDANVVAPTGTVIKYTGTTYGGVYYFTRTHYAP
jgi:hypothetical protein